MLHHPGEVMAVFKPSDKDVKSSDSDVLATLRMWDDNILTLVVENKIASDLKQGDKVLVDYRPYNVGSAQKPALAQKQLVTKIIRGSRAEGIWREYRKYFTAQRQQKPMQHGATSADYMG